MVCHGRRFYNNKLMVRFIEAGTETEAALWPLSKATRRYRIGGIYRVPMSADRATAMFSPTPWEDLDGELPAEEVAALRIADEAAEAAHRAFKGHKKIGDTEAVLGVLEPLRRIYQTADKTNRRLIELTVVDYLRRPP